MKKSFWNLTGLLFGAGCSIGYAAVLAPVLSPAEGDSLVNFPLAITCATPGAEIHYTLTGSEPTLADPLVVSGGTVSIDRNQTVKTAAWLAAEKSATTKGVYTLTGDISAGGAHSLALKSAGAVWAWGLQTDGRLGNNLLTAANVTIPVASKYSTTSLAVADAQMVAAGKSHSVFLKADGTVWSNGLNTTGALGDNSTTSRAMAVQVKTSASLFLTGSVAVAAGDGFGGARAAIQTRRSGTWRSFA